MQCRNVCLVVDLRDGKDLAKITDITAVLSAAGWSTDITLKAYSGESMKLAAHEACSQRRSLHRDRPRHRYLALVRPDEPTSRQLSGERLHLTRV
jgi:hypothetical protein